MVLANRKLVHKPANKGVAEGVAAACKRARSAQGLCCIFDGHPVISFVMVQK